MTTQITYMKGDATQPIGVGNKIIVHICNDVGGWGKGFVLAISKRWTEPETRYRRWYREQTGFALGEVQFVQVEENLWVANLIGQHKMNKDEHGAPPIRYEAVRQGLEKIAAFAKEKEASIHMPRIGCGLAGGTWENMELVILNGLGEISKKTIVYDF